METAHNQETQLMVPDSMARTLPAMVRNELAKLSAQRQEEFVEEYKRKMKSKTTAYVLWFFFGLHYGYMNKWGIQIIFWMTLGGILVWWFIDLFRIGGIIQDKNKDVATDVMRNLRAISG